MRPPCPRLCAAAARPPPSRFSELSTLIKSRSGLHGAALPSGSRTHVRGLYMFGGVGCGKTMLMDLLVASAPREFQVGGVQEGLLVASVPRAFQVCAVWRCVRLSGGREAAGGCWHDCQPTAAHALALPSPTESPSPPHHHRVIRCGGCTFMTSCWTFTRACGRPVGKQTPCGTWPTTWRQASRWVCVCAVLSEWWVRSVSE